MSALLRLVFVVGIGLSANVLFAQEPPKEGQTTPPPQSDTAEPDRKIEPPDDAAFLEPILDKDRTKRIVRPGYGREATLDRRIAAFARLRELMFETIKFNTEKRKKIELMFDDYLAGLLTNTQPPHLQPRPDEMATPQQLPDLKKKLEDAEKSGASPETIAFLKAKIYAANIVLEPNIIDEPYFFFEYVRYELTEEEKKQFDPIFERWRLLRLTEVAPDNDFKQLRRSTRDPQLRETEELARKLDTLILDAIRTVPLGPARTDAEVMKELAAKTKPKVLEILTPAQREHLEKTIVMLKRWDAEDAELAKKERERLKDHKPSHPPQPSVTSGSANAPSNP